MSFLAGREPNDERCQSCTGHDRTHSDGGVSRVGLVGSGKRTLLGGTQELRPYPLRFRHEVSRADDLVLLRERICEPRQGGDAYILMGPAFELGQPNRVEPCATGQCFLAQSSGLALGPHELAQDGRQRNVHKRARLDIHAVSLQYIIITWRLR